LIDLHCHSTASDGLLTPAEVVGHAVAQGLTGLALTDHDTTAGLAAAAAAADDHGLRFVGGCEFSVEVPWGEMHLLGYFIAPGAADLEEFLRGARADRDRRAAVMVTRLSGLGLAISLDDVRRAAGTGSLGRPHVARALLERGYVTTVQQAFDRYIGRGRPAYEPKHLPTFAHVTALVHAHGGVVSAAHLKHRGTREVLAALQAEGLDAVETRHPSHDGEVVANLTHAAEALGLARTGGSDWHGEIHPIESHGMLGSLDVPDAWLDELERRRGGRAGQWT
jgi:predicted metal-dependent phosphoesterase TrpH